MADKLDLVKTDARYYRAKPTPQRLTLEPLSYLAHKGQGAPMGEVFNAAVARLYRTAYGVKKLAKAEGRDFAVPKLEGLWWVAGPPERALETPREQWHWQLLLRLPEFIGEAQVESAREAVRRAKRDEGVAGVRLETLAEGYCVQVLHVGPYDTEPETLERLRGFLRARDLKIAGLHHEIYLSDFRRVAPETRKTILRYPVAAVDEVGMN